MLSATLTGASTCAGLFTGGTTVGTNDFPTQGVILSSGPANSIAGPNSFDSVGGSFNTPGDSDLNSLVPGFSTFDACVLEVQFQCPEGLQGSDLTLKYVFASDEYNEFVNSSYNDVFGWFLNGVNIAVLPSDGTPVTINNVNNGVNSAFYNDNDPSDTTVPFDIEADGFTTKLTAASPTLPGVNTIKLAIADAGDTAYTSWAMIEGGSFKCTNGGDDGDDDDTSGDDVCQDHVKCPPFVRAAGADKRAICHRQGTTPKTLCVSASAVPSHLSQHPNDSCGCCGMDEGEKRRPGFCDDE